MTSQNSFRCSTSEKSSVGAARSWASSLSEISHAGFVIAQQFSQSRLAASHSPDRKKISRYLFTVLITEVEIAYRQPVFPSVKKHEPSVEHDVSATIAWLDCNDCMRKRLGVAEIIACHGAIPSIFRRLPRKCLKYRYL